MKVSIIVPVYNVALYIERCIKSVMNQTYQDIECILVNDATPDNSIAIAERLIADYNGSIQFRILNHEHNKGLSATRNTGVNAATGDYLYFFDSDDEITPDCIESLSRPILNDPTIEMVEGCYVIISKDCNNVITEQIILRPQLEFTTKEAVRLFYFSKQYENRFAWNKLVKRDFFQKNHIYFKEKPCWEDVLWHFHYNKYLCHLYIASDITYKYYIRSSSITRTTKKNQANCFWGVVYDDIVKNFSPDDVAREAKHFLKGFCLFYLDSPTIPIYKQVSSQYLKALKDNHCIKECFFLKSIVLFSKFMLTRKLLKNMGDFLKKQKLF